MSCYVCFIHCFMDLVAKGHLQEAWNFSNTFHEDHEIMHSRDLQKLEGVLSPTHLEKMEFAHPLKQIKFNIKICGYSYELLLQHLHSTQSTTILGIINEHINFQVTPRQTSSISDDPESITLTESNQDAANQINQKEIHWGLLEDSLEEHMEKGGALLSDTEKGEGEAKEGGNDESKTRSIDGGKLGGSIKKVKKDKTRSATGKGAKLEANTVSAAPRVKPELPLPIVVGMTTHKMNKCLGKMEGKGSTHCFKVIQGQYMLPLLVLLGILFFPLQQTQQYSPAGHYFASSSHDRTARIWSVDRIQPLRIMAGHLSDFDCVQWMPTATTLLLAPVTKQFDYGMCRVGSVS